MKRKFYYAFGLIFIILTSAHGQDDSVFDRINGINLKDNIYLRWNETKKTFEYSSDNIDSWHIVDDNIIFKIRNNHGNNFKVLIEFYNPLKYTLKSEITEIDDPAYLALNEFISKLPTLPLPASVNENKDAPTLSFLNANGVTSTVTLEQSILLHEWAYQFSQAIDRTVVASSQANSTEFESLIKSINKIKAADDYLFGKIFISGIPEYAASNFSLNEWIKLRSDIMFGNNNEYIKFKADHETSSLVNKGLSIAKDNAEKSLSDIINLLSNKFDEKILKFIETSKKDDFKKYSNATSVWLSMNHIDRLNANKAAIQKFETYLNKLNDHLNKFKTKVCNKNSECFYYFEDSDVKLKWNSKKMKKYNYEIKKITNEGTEIADSKVNAEFTVGKKLGLYPFVSTSVLYTDFSYPNYTISVNNNTNTVGQAPDTKVNVRPALFLNFIITSWEPVYPFMQIGITTGNNDAIFPVGLGFTLGKAFSISAGPMFGFRKDLNALKVGDIVNDETELKNDLTDKAFVSWYFSINYNLGKK